MQVTPLDLIPDVLLITPDRFADTRGFFSETWHRKRFAEFGIEVDFVQDNHSLSLQKGTVRGLHFQAEPYAQAKLIRVACGSVLDVAVDLRHGSTTYGRHVSCVLSAEAGNQLFIPVGFAHGFVTLESRCEVSYKVSSFYSAAHDRGLMWSDPDLRIAWGFEESEVEISDKDRLHPRLRDLPVHFVYKGHT